MSLLVASTRQEGIPLILRELVLPGGFQREVTHGLSSSVVR